MKYKPIISKKAEKFLMGLKNKKLQNRLILAIEGISENPYLGKSLKGNLEGYFSYRVQDYRIIYEVADDVKILYVLKISHRKDVYQP